MDEQWIKEMQQKMADYQWPAPELSWDELDQALAANHPPKTRLLWLRRIAAAAVILLIAGVGYWGFMHDDTEQILLTTASQNSVNRSLDPVRQNHKPASVIPQPAPAILAKSAQKSDLTDVPVQDVTPVSVTAPDTISIAEPAEEEQPHTAEEKAKPAKQIPSVIYSSDLRERKHLDNRLTAKVYMSSTMASSQIEYSSLQGRAGKDFNPTLIDYHIYHHQPVHFGLSLRYRLINRWSVESGLSYTRLSSDITTLEDGVATMTEQRLNYIGLPVNINYELWKSRYFGLYITSGVMIEKRLDASPWLFSLNGAVGAEYKLTNYFSLYAESGLGYYFKDGSSTPTIYQDRPLNFNLGFGLRFNLE